MARLDNSVLKGIKGSIGGLVIYERNGQTFVRSKPGRIKDAQTPAQLNQRKKMTLVNEFLLPFKTLVSKSFKDTSGRHPYNIAKSYNLRYGTKGEGETLQINLQKALICKGELDLPASVNAEVFNQGIQLSWDTTPGNALDTLIVVLRHKTCNWSQFLFTGVQRQVGSYFWDLKMEELNRDYYFWMAFCDRLVDRMSHSVFVEL